MDKTLNVLLQAMRSAGNAILELQATGFTVTRKENNDLLTQADLLANKILKTELMNAFPSDGWLSEECVDDVERLSHHRVWVVDPIDGTIEYSLGIPEYGISVALVENGMPIVASVFNPAAQELFYAVKGQGAWLNDEKINCSRSADKKMLLLASRSEYKRGEWDEFIHEHEVKVVGSIAYKLALVAAGRAQATFSLGPKNEWDIAAGVLLVQEAGGVVTTQHRKPFVFNQKNVLVEGIVASAANVNEKIFSMIQDCKV